MVPPIFMGFGIFLAFTEKLMEFNSFIGNSFFIIVLLSIL
jgi:hypothetical protein